MSGSFFFVYRTRLFVNGGYVRFCLWLGEDAVFGCGILARATANEKIGVVKGGDWGGVIVWLRFCESSRR